MNAHYKKLCALIAVLTDGDEGISNMVFNALVANKTSVSKSRVHGWGVAPDSRNYREMTSEEFFDVLVALKNYLEDR